MGALELGILLRGLDEAIGDEAALAESLGFDSIWLGASASASPAIALAAIAARTSRVRLGAAVPLDATLDPVRLAEDFATVDAIADGRVELVAGSIGIDADPAPGGAPDRSGERVRESAILLRRLWSETCVTWSGRFRPPLAAVTVEPRPAQRPHPPLWIGAGSSPHAVDLAAELGLPLMLPGARALAPLVDRYRRRFAEAGHDPAAARVGCWERVRVGETAQAAAEVAARIGAARRAVGLDVLVAAFDADDLPPAAVARARERFAAEVTPLLR